MKIHKFYPKDPIWTMCGRHGCYARSDWRVVTCKQCLKKKVRRKTK